jgi:hypothetical protein
MINNTINHCHTLRLLYCRYDVLSLESVINEEDKTLPPPQILGEVFGQCDPEQRTEFQNCFEKFTGDLGDAIKSLSGGIELQRLADEWRIDSKVTSYHDVVKDHPEIVSHFEQVLEEWCRQIEQYLEETLESSDKGGVRIIMWYLSDLLKVFRS